MLASLLSRAAAARLAFAALVPIGAQGFYIGAGMAPRTSKRYDSFEAGGSAIIAVEVEALVYSVGKDENDGIEREGVGYMCEEGDDEKNAVLIGGAHLRSTGGRSEDGGEDSMSSGVLENGLDDCSAMARDRLRHGRHLRASCRHGSAFRAAFGPGSFPPHGAAWASSNCP